MLQVSIVTEIREAISLLSEQDRYLLMAELFATMPEPEHNDPELLAALDEGLADEAAGRVYSIDEVRAMIVPRSQVVLGNALVGEAVLPSG